MSVLNATSHQHVRWMKPVGRILAGLLLLVLTVLVLSWATVQFWIVPRIDAWRVDLETVATRALGSTVQIGAVETQDRGWWRTPIWVLRDVRVLNPQGQNALQLGQVQAAFSWSSLLRQQGFDQLVVDKAQVNVRRSADGRWWVAGWDVTPKGPSDGAGLRWVLAQAELALRQGQLTWTDELNQREPVTLSDVQVAIRRQGTQHTASVSLTPPPGWGERWTLQADVRDTVWGDAPPDRPWAHWTGTVHWDAPRLDAAPWAAQAAVWPGVPEVVKHLQGHGAVQAWLSLEAGRPTAASVRLDWPELSTRADAQTPRLALRDAQGLLRADWAQGLGVSLEGVRARTDAGLRVAVEQLDWRRTVSADGREATDRLDARGVDARDWVALSRAWPLPGALAQTLARWQPAAQVDELSAQWAWRLDGQAPPVWANTYQAQGRVRDIRAIDVGAPGSPAQPGVRGLAVNFAANQTGGQAQLDMVDGAVSLPGVLDESLVPVQALQAGVGWRIDAQGLQADVRGLRVATPDWRGELQAQWRTAVADKPEDRWPGVLDLKAQLHDVAVSRLHRYLPSAVSPGVRRYVKEAFVAGQAPQVLIRVKGDLRDLPLGRANAQGVFLVEADLEHVDFDYLPTYLQAPTDAPWPRLQEASTALRFDGLSLAVGPIQAAVQGAPGVRVSDARVSLTDLASGPVRLSVNLNTQGPSPSFLQVVNGSPLHRMTGGVLAQAQASGDLSGALAMQMQLADDPQLRVQGHVAMRGVDLRWTPHTPMAQAIDGRIDFSETGFTVAPSQARLLGEVFRVRGGTQAVPRGQPSLLVFDVEGRLSAQGLRQAELGAVSRLASHMTGATAVSLRLGLRGGVPEVDLRSDLAGLGLNLPAPLTKAQGIALPLHLHSAVQSVRGTQVTGDRWRLSLGEGPDQRVGADLQRDLMQPQASWRGHAWVGQAPSQAPAATATGWALDVQVPRLDADAWLAVLTPPAAASSPAETRAGPAPLLDTSAWPQVVRLSTEVLQVRRRELHAVVVVAEHEALRWRLDLSAKEALGRVDLNLSPDGGLAKVHARLSRLSVPDASQADVESFIAQPLAVPALDVVIEDMTVGRIGLGRVEVDASNHGEGAQQSWQLNQLRVTLPEGTLSAQGLWAMTLGLDPSLPNKSTVLQFQLDVRDAGAMLDRLGQPGNLRKGQGSVSGSVAWAGSPITPDMASLSGQWQLRLENGQILKIEPGAGRLLGILTLQSLPRRFLLDFRDTFVAGYAFDDISGQIDMAQGVASSDNLRLRSILADVRINGQVDLVQRTQDFRLRIVPEINVGTASVGLLAINPVLGLSTLMGQLLLRSPLKAWVTQYMQVTGTWAQPLVTKTAAPASPQPQ
ncbi:MAG: hypothetical protein RL297_2298 [Pseudomonadota bacterium]